MPAVEVYVERHDAAGCHAGDQSSEGAESHICKSSYSRFLFTAYFPGILPDIWKKNYQPITDCVFSAVPFEVTQFPQQH